jgi:hypothetical protein
LNIRNADVIHARPAVAIPAPLVWKPVLPTTSATQASAICQMLPAYYLSLSVTICLSQILRCNISHSFSLSLCLSLSVTICLSHSLSVCFSLSLCRCLSLYLSFCLSLCQILRCNLSHSLSVSLCLSLSVTICLSHSRSVCFSLSFCRYLSVYFQFLFLSVSLEYQSRKSKCKDCGGSCFCVPAVEK